MTDWARLRHAYGTAEDVPALLAAADASGRESGPAWEALWGRLCHQGSVYPASYAALPALADLAARRAPAGYLAAVHLAADILAARDTSGDRGARAEHAGAVAALRERALAGLPLATGDVEPVYGLQAVMAFEGVDPWQRHLQDLADGEAELVCPRCGAQLLLDLASTPPAVADPEGSGPATPVEPATPAAGTVGYRLLALAREHASPAVVAGLGYLLGRARCPRCGQPFEVPAALA